MKGFFFFSKKKQNRTILKIQMSSTNSSSTTSFSIREAQTDALTSMLNLNHQENKGQSAWKVLIYDDFCQSIISPLLNVGQLREQGVTLHLNLNAKRLAVTDVPAVYFVLPTPENVDRICRDLKENLYDQFHINFARSTPRVLLERLAESALESESVAQISKVYDQYLGFQSLAPELFTLGEKESYVAFNDSKISDAQAQSNIESCVEGLFAALSVCGAVPIIRCPRNGAAEMVARALATRLAEHSASHTNHLAGAQLAAFRRPLLVLVERSVDLAAMLHHPWTYGALLHDVLGLKANRVYVKGEKNDENDNDKNDKVFDLDASDNFWSMHCGAPFQQVAVEVKQQLGEYQSRLARLDALAGDNSQTDELGGFVSEIPELQAKKATIEKHVSIATALLQQIKKRELDRFYALEEALLARGTCDRTELKRLLTNNIGTSADRVRLLVVYYLCAVERAGASAAVVSEFTKLENSLSDDLSVLHHIRQSRAHHQHTALPPTSATGGAGGKEQVDEVDDRDGWAALQKGYDSLSAFTGIFSEGVDRLKSLLPREQELPVTRVVRSLMEQKSDKSIDSFLYFDPKVDGGRALTAPSAEGNRSAFREGIVFVIGGGNYTEYQNLMDYASGASQTTSNKRSTAVVKKTIIYGSTELANAEQFTEQLKKLSK